MKKLKITVSMTLLLCSMLAISQAQTIDPNKYYRLTNKNLGEKESLTATDDGAIMQPSVKNTLLQYWKLIPQGDGTYNIFCFRYGQPKNIVIKPYGDTYNLQFTDPSKATDQLWTLTPSPNNSGYWIIDNKSQNNKSMTSDVDTQAFVEMQTTTNSDAQNWKITELTSTLSFDENKYYRIQSTILGKSRSLDGGEDGVVIDITKNIQTQYWKIIKQADGLYKLQNTSLGVKKVMDIENDGVNSTKPIMDTNTNAAGQFWLISKNDDGSYRFNNGWQAQDALACHVVEKPDNIVVKLINNEGLPSANWTITEVTPTED